MTIVITGATGHLGGLTIDALLARGVPADDILATGRSTTKLAELAERGVRVRAWDYTDADSLRAVFDGTERVLFVSGSEVGQRLPQHRNVIAALTDTKPELVAYTSIAHADTAQLHLAAEHLATERLLAD